MKYKILGISMMLVVLFCALAASLADQETGTRRIHQHMTSRQPEAGCECDGTELCTHLPLVLIDTDGEEIPGERVNNSDTIFSTTSEGDSMLTARVSILDNESSNHHPSDPPDLETSMLIRIRGNSSRSFDKKNYLMRFVDEEGNYENHEVMGMAAHYEWALHGPYLDKTLIRNYMWYNIAGEMMEYAPNVRFCEVILNGEYLGLYVMTETITRGEDCRIHVSEPIEGTNETGYILRMDRGSSNELKNINNFTYYVYRINRKYDRVMNIEYPRAGSLTQELADAIEQDFSDFEKALYSYDYDTHDYGYQNWIDVDSFVDYFILNEFTQNYDAGYLSTYISKDIRGKYQMIVWDFNNACDNYYETTMDIQGFQMQDMPWQWMLTKDEDYDQRIIDRYHMWRETFLNDDYLVDYIDDVIAYLGDAVARNFEVWGYSFTEYRPLNPDSRNPSTYEEAVKQLKKFIYERGAWMDYNIEAVKQYGHPSYNKRYNH